MSRSLRVALAWAAAALLAGPALLHAAPAMSRGQQFLPISQQDCVARAQWALQSSGYTLWDVPGNGPWGHKGIHSAVIFCEMTVNNQEVVDIVVASDGNDGNVPGAERVRLQELMAQGPTQQAGSPCPTNAVELRGTGRQLTCWCTPESTRGGSVWGSDVYTDDSGICRAAVHAGIVGPGGGWVKIRALPGQSAYYGSAKNGVITTDYPAWSGSYRFE